MTTNPILLMIDDEPDILDFLARVFRKQYTLLRAENAHEALGLLAQHRVDLVISDQRMPGLTGLELFARLAETWPEVTRVLLSGFSDLPEITQALLSGFSDLPEITQAATAGLVHAYVVKPVDSQHLREAVEEAEARRKQGNWVR
jgi:YesN/AraC family two-component response regulator